MSKINLTEEDLKKLGDCINNGVDIPEVKTEIVKGKISGVVSSATCRRDRR